MSIRPAYALPLREVARSPIAGTSPPRADAPVDDRAEIARGSEAPARILPPSAQDGAPVAASQHRRASRAASVPVRFRDGVSGSPRSSGSVASFAATSDADDEPSPKRTKTEAQPRVGRPPLAFDPAVTDPALVKRQNRRVANRESARRMRAARTEEIRAIAEERDGYRSRAEALEETLVRTLEQHRAALEANAFLAAEVARLAAPRVDLAYFDDLFRR